MHADIGARDCGAPRPLRHFLQVCTPLPEHCVAPGAHTPPQVPVDARLAGARDCGAPRPRGAAGLHTVTRASRSAGSADAGVAPAMQAWFAHATAVPHVPVAVHVGRHRPSTELRPAYKLRCKHLPDKLGSRTPSHRPTCRSCHRSEAESAHRIACHRERNYRCKQRGRVADEGARDSRGSPLAAVVADLGHEQVHRAAPGVQTPVHVPVLASDTKGHAEASVCHSAGRATGLRLQPIASLRRCLAHSGTGASAAEEGACGSCSPMCGGDCTSAAEVRCIA